MKPVVTSNISIQGGGILTRKLFKMRMIIQLRSQLKKITQCLDHLINFIIGINNYSKREAVKSDERVFTSAEFFSEKWYSTWIIIMKIIF